MFEQIAFLTVLIGSSVGAAYDLKTTEIPDQIFNIMFGIGLAIVLLNCYFSSSIWPFVTSAAIGSILLAFGFLMYKGGQWGGADAKMIAVIGFLIPSTPAFIPNLFFPFPFSYLINVFLIGTPYMLLYAAVIAVRNKKILERFSKDMKSSAKMITISSVLLFIVLIATSFYLVQRLDFQVSYGELVRNSIFPVIATIGLFVVYKFAKSVEDVGFRRKIPISKLRVGDILNESRELEGITPAQLGKIKKSGKRFVVIKEGIRFGPAFPLALLFTFYFGDAILLLIKALV